MRWPLYIFEAAFALAALALTLYVWQRRGRGYPENLVIVPWLLASAVFALYLLAQVARNGWQDIQILVVNVVLANVLSVAGPASVVIVMLLRMRK